MTYRHNRDVAIVIPGGPRGSSDRITAALKSYKKLGEKGHMPYLIATGFFLNEVIYESLRDSGVPADIIIREDRAKSTEENVINSVEICKERGWKNMLFSTSYYQAKRMVGEIEEHVPDDFNVGWVYEEPNFSDIGYDAFLVGRYLHELVATIKDMLGGKRKEGSTVEKVAESLLRIEGEIFSRLGFG